MGYIEILLTAVALSMDAFAVSICTGLTMERFKLRSALIVGLYFGAFQAAMPLAGYMAANLFADMIVSFDHWIAFALLSFIGARMVAESLKLPECDDCEAEGGVLCEASLAPARMLPLSIATSIDAMAVGVSLAFLSAEGGVKILPAVSFIGVTTLILSMVGVKVGHVFGARYKSKAELAGGVILILMGIKILLEHLGIISL